jgi:hypothetical protein
MLPSIYASEIQQIRRHIGVYENLSRGHARPVSNPMQARWGPTSSLTAEVCLLQTVAVLPARRARTSLGFGADAPVLETGEGLAGC